VSNTIEENSPAIRLHESALSRFFCSPLSPMNVAGLPRWGRLAAGFGWTMVRSSARSSLQKTVGWASAIPGDVHLAVMRNPGLG